MALTSISAVTVVPRPRGRTGSDISVQIVGSCTVEYTLDPDPATATAWIATGITNPVANAAARITMGITGLRLTPTGTISYAVTW